MLAVLNQGSEVFAMMPSQRRTLAALLLSYSPVLMPNHERQLRGATISHFP